MLLIANPMILLRVGDEYCVRIFRYWQETLRSLSRTNSQLTRVLHPVVVYSHGLGTRRSKRVANMIASWQFLDTPRCNVGNARSESVSKMTISSVWRCISRDERHGQKSKNCCGSDHNSTPGGPPALPPSRAYWSPASRTISSCSETL